MYWEHCDKTKYYRATVARDLVGHLVVMKENGSLKTRNARRWLMPVATVAAGEEEITRLDKIRRRHGYRVKHDPLEQLMQADR